MPDARHTHASSPPRGLAPEARLLLAAVRDQPADTVDACIAEGVDWSETMRCASDNRIVPQLCAALDSVAWRGVPGDFFPIVRHANQRVALHALQLVAELTRIATLLRDEGIEFLAYKGPELAQRLYGHATNRQSWDLDLMVHPRDVPRVKQLLEGLDYTVEARHLNASIDEIIRHDCEINFDRPGDGMHVEIHWRVLPPRHAPRFDDQWLWSQTQRITMGSLSLPCLRPEALFLVLCLHGGEKHCWARMRWLCDIDRFLRLHPDLDWLAVLERAREMRIERAAGVGLYLAGRMLGAPLPPAAEAFVAGRDDFAGLAALVRGRIFSLNLGLPGFRDWRAYLRAHESAAPTTSAPPPARRLWLRYLCSVMTPEWHDREMLPALPRWMGFMHYLMRPIRLFSRHKAQLIKRTA